MSCRPSLFLTLILIWSTLAAGYQSTAQKPEDEPLKLSAQLVVLDAQVLSKKTGLVVGGLAREDFTLYEDGIKQQITHFSQDKLPLSIILLVDVSASVRPVIDRIRDEALVALAQLRSGDEVAVMIFGKWAELFQDFTRDRELIAKRIGAIKRIGPWIQEGTYINEAVYAASKHVTKASNPDSRRIVIIVTDNIKSEPIPLGHSDSEAMEAVMESGVALCGLVVGDFAALARDYSTKGWHLADSIGHYIDETGGIAVQVDKDNVAAKLAALIERLRTRYSFGYTSRNENRDGKFRRISLQVSPELEHRQGGITIITRKGYYAPGR